MYYLGVDLGGTNIKAGLVTESCAIVCADSRDTMLPRSPGAVCGSIVDLCMSLLAEGGVALHGVAGIGIGCPGNISSRDGIVKRAYNLGFFDFPMRDYMQSKMEGVPAHIGNDANVAAYGEYRAGSAVETHSSVLITLGTGVGAGIVIGGQIVEGVAGGASEFGHTVIQRGGRQCTCGSRGCWEAYSSATGLIAMSREAMERNPESVMWEIAREAGKVSGKTAFAAMKRGDAAAGAVVEEYIAYLACGIGNVINALQPEVVSLGGGLSREGDPLLRPLIEAVKKETFGGGGALVTEIKLSALGNDAGIIGAAMLGEKR